jgi:tetratricopeptide (TPR) repeat protein
MKRLFGLVLLGAALVSAPAQNLDDEYVQIFNLIQEADGLSSVHPSQALAKYLEAQKGLQQLRSGSPDWNPSVVAFRLNYVTSKIAAISPQASIAGTNVESAAKVSGVVPAAPAAAGAPSDWEAQLNALKEQTRQLQADKGALEVKLKEALAMQPAESDPRELARAEEKVKALQKENDLLKVTVEDAKSKAVSPVVDTKALETAQQSLAESNRQLSQQKELNSKLTLEKEALDSRVKQLSSTTASSSVLPAPGTEDASRVKQLEHERDALQKQLDAANKQLYGRKGKGAAARVDDLENQVSVLRARLEILEARRVPYSTEELALFKQPDTQLTTPESKPAKKTVHDLPPGSAALVTEAQKYFSAQQYDKAETAYLQVLKMDQKNVPALANLSAIQVEEKHYDDAEANVKQALAIDPEDAYSLYVMGLLKFHQNKYDDALDALSHAAKVDPQKAEIQNYLGLVLSEKGMRGPAETALRKAVELQPGYAGAHHNLAVFYLTQQPRYPALARWHYQKALAAGSPRNPELEKMFDENK